MRIINRISKSGKHNSEVTEVYLWGQSTYLSLYSGQIIVSEPSDHADFSQRGPHGIKSLKRKTRNLTLTSTAPTLKS